MIIERFKLKLLDRSSQDLALIREAIDEELNRRDDEQLRALQTCLI